MSSIHYENSESFFGNWTVHIPMESSHNKTFAQESRTGSCQEELQASQQFVIFIKSYRKVMLKQFNEHCDNYGLLLDYQSAYRSNYSCETSLLKLTNDILWNMESKQVTALVMMDLSAAFDTVDHELLLEILHHRYGISDDALGWYDNYLRPRGFKVCVGDSYSKERPLAFSVPQGSCSGAVLFIAYIESLSNIILHPIQLAGFADDHSICDSFKPDSDRNAEKQTIDRLQEAMSDTKKWMDSV